VILRKKNNNDKEGGEDDEIDFKVSFFLLKEEV
jgi:hypothetical protein